jgi:predicted molibdopterin-dependent oxidoreductase YjgC
LENQLFLKDNCEGFEAYKTNLLKERFDDIYKKAGVSNKESFEKFALNYNNEMNAIILFSEKEVSANTSFELFNLAMITGKLGKTSSGLISLKEKNNSQGLFDMGICTKLGVGGVPVDNKELVEKMKSKWGIKDVLAATGLKLKDQLESGKLKNIFIFGEDPIGCAIDSKAVSKWFTMAEFTVVQDYFITETAKTADLILPASFPFESGGTYSNTQKVLQKFEKQIESNIEYNSCEQLIKLNEKFGFKGLNDVVDVMMEAINMLPQEEENKKHVFRNTDNDNPNKLFEYGCDYIVKYFEDGFNKAFMN